MSARSQRWKLNAIPFNGIDSQIVIPHNPLAGVENFTIGALFLPEAGGEAEQRFVHVQGDDESRALLELRSSDHGWYADTFVHFSSGERFLNDPELLHPFGEWHTLALVYDGCELRQYVNGQMELKAPAPEGRLSDVRPRRCWMNPMFAMRGRLIDTRGLWNATMRQSMVHRAGHVPGAGQARSARWPTPGYRIWPLRGHGLDIDEAMGWI